MQGWRIYMEDSHTHILQLNEDPDASFFGVYDGHGGSRIADSLSKNLHKYVLRRPEYASGDYKTAIEEGFLECDAAMKEDESLQQETSGSTAITALIREKKKLCTFRMSGILAVLGFRGDKTIGLSEDHKPFDPKEQHRIESAGGYVEFNRVNGNLALSRALGDFEFKKNATLPPEKQIVSCFPEIVEKEIDDSWNFVVLACDGIWDVLSNEEVVNFVASRIALNQQPEVICEKLMNRCLSEDSGMSGFGCDNMTVIIVCFLHNKPYSRLVERCASYITKLKAKWSEEAIAEDEAGETNEGDKLVSRRIISSSDSDDEVEEDKKEDDEAFSSSPITSQDEEGETKENTPIEDSFKNLTISSSDESSSSNNCSQANEPSTPTTTLSDETPAASATNTADN
ncbi:PTC2_3 [Lepeophtheirus salmonis]|uniref:protein-serine/threonine phosphatase n=1 Tax=Lepeophtheirus salmonis TaxID=72036 RepID=A0A7R8H0C0_LEPSM|nr:PTC2_3 [Lepeophtheirus salmonis]CAF2783120.1 PTC2_3 [Lepeophtheirus salmonis]